MVHGAQAGDHFFFACWCHAFLYIILIIDDPADSGHSGQVTNRNNSEEDGQDEGWSDSSSYSCMLLTLPFVVIISCDGKDLIDNVSNAFYVRPLSVGLTLEPRSGIESSSRRSPASRLQPCCKSMPSIPASLSLP